MIEHMKTVPADDPEQHPDFATWTWDVHVYGGQWRAEYGWERPLVSKKGMAPINVRPLYKHPKKREPLTDREIEDAECGDEIAHSLPDGWVTLKRFARAIERAHGIGIPPADAKEGGNG